MAALLGPDGAWLAHVGDCRAYRVRDGALSVLTREHDLPRALADQGGSAADIAEARERHSNVVTQVLGLGSPVKPDRMFVALNDLDRLVLMTDGVHRMLDDAELAARLITDPPAAAIELVLDEIAARGSDNAAIAIIAATTA